MKHTLFAVTAIAALSFTTAAFAEGENDPFPLNLPQQTETVANPARDTNSQAYPAPLHTITNANAVALLPTNGGSNGVESLNSVPAGFAVGTEPYTAAQTLARWESQQNREGFAAAPTPTLANGG